MSDFPFPQEPTPKQAAFEEGLIRWAVVLLPELQYPGLDRVDAALRQWEGVDVFPIGTLFTFVPLTFYKFFIPFPSWIRMIG